MRRRSSPLFLALIASLAVTAVTLGGGWAQVTVTEVPADPTADGETTIGLTVMQHGDTAVSWPTLTVVATNTESGATVRTDARPMGQVGAYVATVVFPTAGEWALAFESRDLIMEGSAVVGVAPSAVAAAADSRTPATGPSDATALTLALGFLALAVLGLAALVVRGRRGARPDAPVSVRG